MQSFLKTIGYITIFLGIIIGIYLLYDALSSYSSIKADESGYSQQIYVVKLIAGGAIIILSVISGILYMSFSIVIELLENINNGIIKLIPPKKEEVEEEIEQL